ncbi:hypothetical protein [Nocardioides houyundeii]|uniref:hypothetical protein n=1 Tax=Nocardioides houyundeii TaxID=2045452 RepID=UPI000DF1A504|nr:hypothetical protein [Nocardioides houyundeii]
MRTSLPNSAPKRRFPAASILLAAVLAVLLTGCGEDSSDTASDDSASTPGTSVSSSPSPEGTPTESTEEEATPEGPLCEEVWVDGQVLPRRYQGCLDGTKWREAFVYPCSSGQNLVTFGRTFYAAKGERVVESATPLAKNPQFQSALSACGA